MKWIGCLLALFIVLLAAHLVYKKNRIFEETRDRLDRSCEEQQQTLSATILSLKEKTEELKAQMLEQEKVVADIAKERDEVKRKNAESEQAIALLEERIQKNKSEIDRNETTQDRSMAEMNVISEKIRDNEQDVRVLKELLNRLPPVE
jgi:septal ring factor EnvC (AmiA/AmiB activator)